MLTRQAVRRFFHRVTLARPFTRIYDRFSIKKTLGDRGEREAERFLLRRGMVIIDRGFTDRYGEIDLIAVEGKTVVFVEVKTRTSDFRGLPAEAVDERKQRSITKIAQGYLKFNNLMECRVRFDVVSIIWPEPNSTPHVVHYESAFEAYGDFQMY